MVSLGVDRAGVMRAADKGAAMVVCVLDRLIIECMDCVLEAGVDGRGVRGVSRGERRLGMVDGCITLLQDGVTEGVAPLLLQSIKTVEFTSLSASAFCLSVFCKNKIQCALVLNLKNRDMRKDL